MIQIGNFEPLPEGLPADLDKIFSRSEGEGRRSDDLPAADSGDALLFVSPPPAPWPRVFPGL